jgi:hypothetical protein
VKPTRPLTLIGIAAVCAAITWSILEIVYNSLPVLPWTMVPALLVAAGAEAWAARDLRTRIRKPDAKRPVPVPEYTMRMLALAKASSLAGSVIGGVAAGFVFYTSGSWDVPTPRQDLITAAVIFGACVVLTAAAFFLENSCRVPDAPR